MAKHKGWVEWSRVELGRLQNGYFLRLSVTQMRAVFERKVWSECENGEWN